MTQHMESYNKGLAREMTGSTHTLPILNEYAWSMARVWLEYGWSMAKDCNATLRPQVREWLKIATPHSDRRSENAWRLQGHTHRTEGQTPCAMCAFRYVACLLLLMVLGVNSAWGAFTEGLYYIKSNKNTAYFLCPSIGCYYGYNVDQPHLTTFKTDGDQYSIWKIVPVEGETDTYYIIHYKTGRYLKSNEDFTTDNGTKHNRKAVHLEVKPETLTDDFKFFIKNNSSPYQIYPKVYYTTASGMSFNPTGEHKDCYAPEDGGDGAKGMIGLYLKTDDFSKWQIPSVASAPCATPIIKYDGDNINISYPYSDETGITIYYTTDGSDPSTGTSNASTNFNISASGVIKVRAIATKTGLVNSDEAVLWGSARPLLIQSKECADYYLVPAGNGTNVNTSSLPGTSMQWTLQNAGASTGGVQYYYVVNSNSKKINCNLDNTLTLNDESADANKFCVIENGYGTSNFFLIPVSQPNRVLYKNKGNVEADNCKVEFNKKWNTNLDQWNLRVCNDGADQKNLFKAPPFILSDTETNYYLISCAGDPSGYYIIPPGASSDYAMTSNTNDEYEESPWMFKTAASDNWRTYYYIVNAKTGKYMYFNGNNKLTAALENAISMKAISESTTETEDKFQFIFVPSTTANAYYIVPKAYADNFRSNYYYGIWFKDENTQVLQTTWSRSSGANNVKWTFSKFAYCNNPVFTESDGNISISCITTNSEIYITNDGTEPNISDNSQKYSAENTLSASNQHLIKAKAVVYDNQTPVSSRVVTLFNIPDVTLEAGPFVYKADYWEPAVTLSIGETTATTGFTPTYNNNKNAGTANVTITNSDPNSTVYVLNGPLTEFTIDPAPLTVTANTKTIGYGDEPDNDGVIYSGFVGNPAETEDTEGVFVGTLSYSYNTASDGTGTEYASYDSPIGTYYIIPSGLTSTNYNITFVSGTMTVGTKSIGNGNLAEGFTLDFDENSEVILEYGTHPLTKDVDYTIGSEVIGTKYSTRDFNGNGNYTGYFTLRNANVNFQTDADRVEWSATFVAEPVGENARDNTKGHALPEGITAYIITDIVGNWAIPEPLTYIPEGIPVLLISNKETGGFIVKDANPDPDPDAGEIITDVQINANMLKEVTSPTHFNTKTIYLLSKNEFVYNLDGDLAVGKVYLDPTPLASPAPRLRIKWDDMTSIAELQNHGTTESPNDSWYALDGRKLNKKPTQKGMYLVNGKKVIIR